MGQASDLLCIHDILLNFLSDNDSITDVNDCYDYIIIKMNDRKYKIKATEIK